MSDGNRKAFHTRFFEAVVPNFMKTKQEKAKESTTDHADDVAREVQPDSNKGPVQEAVDKLDRGKDRAVRGGTAPVKVPRHKTIFGRRKQI